jgi:K+/H+ antiporter YhaU regulatory subunit KhtT
MGLGDDLKRRALEFSQKAVERLMSDEKRAAKVAQAIGAVQRSKQSFDRTQGQVMHALNLAAKSDFKAVGKQLSSLKRRLRELDEKLDELEAR